MRMQIRSERDPSHVDDGDDSDDSDFTAHQDEKMMELPMQQVEQFHFSPAALSRDQKIIAAIDIGTCNTKMAFACYPLTHRGDVQIIVMNAWESSPGAMVAPTIILIDHTGEVAAYGYDAEEKFRVLPAAQVKGSYLFKNFKMALHRNEVGKELAVHTKK